MPSYAIICLFSQSRTCLGRDDLTLVLLHARLLPLAPHPEVLTSTPSIYKSSYMPFI